VYTDDNNTTHVGMLRFGDCDISEDNAKTSAQHKTANLTFKTPNLTIASVNMPLNEQCNACISRYI